MGPVPKNLVVFEGSEHASREIACQKLIERSQFGWRRFINPGLDELEGLAQAGWVQEDPMGLVIRFEGPEPEWGFLLSELAEQHRLCVFNYEGEVPVRSPLGELVSKLDGGRRFSFPLPKPWEQKGRAVEFGRSRLVEAGKIDEGACRALVDQGVIDLGLLGMELRKLVWFVGDRKGITAEDVAQMGLFGGPGPLDDLQDALALRDSSRVLYLAGRIADQEPIMKVVAMVGRMGYQWGCVAAHPGGDEECGRDLKVHPYIVKTKLRPAANRWGRERAFRLVGLAGRVGMLVRQGGKSPWGVLRAGLFMLSDRKH